MEDFQLDVVIGQGPARALDPARPAALHAGRRDHARRPADLAAARSLRLVARLDYYPPSDLVEILRAFGAAASASRSADEAAGEIARRARGTPRIATACCAACATSRRSRVASASRASRRASRTRSRASRSSASRSTTSGFDRLDRAFLRALIEKFDGGPVGLETLAAALGEDKGTLEDLVEPFLIQGGFLDRTPRGRVATPRAFEHFGVPLPTAGQRKLF